MPGLGSIDLSLGARVRSELGWRVGLSPGLEAGLASIFSAMHMCLGGAIHHDLHHQWPSTNFQPFFTYMDSLCGTDYQSSRFAKAAREGEKTHEPPSV